MNKIPELDYAEYLKEDTRQKFITEFTQALKDVGFLILKNHPVDNKLIKKAYDVSRVFFLKSEEYKQQYMNPKARQSGFIPFGTEHAKNTSLFDLKEFWQVVNDFEMANPTVPNIWTDDKEFNETLLSLYKNFMSLSAELMRVVGKGIDIPKDYLEELVKDQNSVLRIIHYPPVDQKHAGHVRAAAHEDINMLTIMPGASEGGLEVLSRDGQWIPVEANYEYLIIDSGDMLARITNEVIQATTHRVVNPADTSSHRFSMPFFCHTNPEVILKCLDSCKGSGEKYPPIKSLDFLNERLKAIGIKK